MMPLDFASGSLSDRRSQVRTRPNHSLEPLVALIDAVAIFLNGIIAAYLYQMVVLGVTFSSVPSGSYAALSLLASVLYVSVSKATGIYQNFLFSSKSTALRQSISAWLATIALLGFTSFLLKNTSEFSRGTTALFAAMGILTIIINRLMWPMLAKFLVVKGQIFATRALLIRTYVGSDQRKLPSLLEGVASAPKNGLLLTHQLELDLDNLDSMTAHLPIVRNLIVGREIDEIHLELPQSHLHRVSEIIGVMRLFPVPVRLILDPVTAAVVRRPMKEFGQFTVVELQREPLNWAERFCKRTLDIAVASAAIIIFAPLLLMVALLVKLESRGPIFFVQDRMGSGDKPFKIFKFRSMNVTENGPVIKQATSHDSRLTRIGKFMRRTSIDELPQLLNVLLGDMSIVGPRPHAVAHDNMYSKLIAEYALRHHVKPGLTGLSQVMGLRGETSNVEQMKARVETDIAYINNWSLWNDLLIILKTVYVVLAQRQAY